MGGLFRIDAVGDADIETTVRRTKSLCIFQIAFFNIFSFVDGVEGIHGRESACAGESDFTTDVQGILVFEHELSGYQTIGCVIGVEIAAAPDVVGSLIFCIENAQRSQIVEAFAEELFYGEFNAIVSAHASIFKAIGEEARESAASVGQAE